MRVACSLFEPSVFRLTHLAKHSFRIWPMTSSGVTCSPVSLSASITLIGHSLTARAVERRAIRRFHLNTNSGLARPAGFEPAATRLEGECSIQLSYGRLTVRYTVREQAAKRYDPLVIQNPEPDRPLRRRVLYPTELRARERVQDLGTRFPSVRQSSPSPSRAITRRMPSGRLRASELGRRNHQCVQLSGRPNLKLSA